MTTVVAAVVLLALIAAAAYLVLGKHLTPSSTVAPPLGFPQAFRYCPVCRRNGPAATHSTACWRCLTCQHITHPGDPT